MAFEPGVSENSVDINLTESNHVEMLGSDEVDVTRGPSLNGPFFSNKKLEASPQHDDRDDRSDDRQHC